ELSKRIGMSKNQPIVVDTRSFGEYQRGHIPGAVNIDLFQLHWFDTSKRGIKDFNRQTRILLFNIGIKRKSHVIFYDDVSGTSAARGVWLLLYFSHKKVSMLDGGFEVWKKAGYPIEVKSNLLVPSEFKGKINTNLVSTAEEVKKSLKNKKVIILDARSTREFDGSDVRAARRGHIPSAINIDWQRNIANSSFKKKAKLSKIYSQIPRNSKIITYCQGGYRAANAFVVLKMLGFKNVKMYLGSWGEWGNRLSLPVSDLN
ncbi:MAG TPA: sulfurtransferase, partial [Nitrososphaeraceae archaeon]|nr:sulfurtransferase [Nitrososphaeraceae archaeon]